MNATPFAINPLPYNELEHTKTDHSNFLDNYNFIKPNLPQDFYFLLFLNQVLFDIDILDLEDFLYFQIENSNNPSRLLKILELKVIPEFENILNNPIFLQEDIKRGAEKDLDHGFFITDNTVYHESINIHIFKHKSFFSNFNSSLPKRLEIIRNALAQSDSSINSEVLNWKGKPAHLAFIIGELIDNGYIDPPLHISGDINYSAVARQILQSFNFKESPSEVTLRKYSNPDDEKNQEVREKLKKNGLTIPHSKMI